MPESEQVKDARRRAWANAMSVGWELSSFTLLGLAAGWWFDKRFRSSPWGVLVGALVGIVSGLYRLIRTFARAQDGGAGRR